MNNSNKQEQTSKSTPVKSTPAKHAKKTNFSQIVKQSVERSAEFVYGFLKGHGRQITGLLLIVVGFWLIYHAMPAILYTLILFGGVGIVYIGLKLLKLYVITDFIDKHVIDPILKR